MRVANFQFEPKLFVTLAYVLVAGVMLRLGVWQLNQAERKQLILTAAEQSSKAPALSLKELTSPADAAKAHRKISFVGQYQPQRQFLWDNRVHKGQAGYEVITPVQTTEGQWVLVNRGWIAPGASRSELPSIAFPESAIEQAVPTQGVFSQPSKGLASGDAFIAGNNNWPKVLQFFDYQAISEVLGVPVIEGVVQPQLASEDNPDSNGLYFAANWEPTATMGPARHHGYAFQWFAMAFALTALFIWYNTKRVKR